jgi:hypothetical protein
MENKIKNEPKHKVEVSSVKPSTFTFVEEQSLNILELTDEVNLDGKITSLTNYMSNTNGFGKTDEQKDEDYLQAQNMWKEYQRELRSVKFNFYLDRSQFNLLTDILLKKLEYDSNNIFIAIELTELLGGMSGASYKNDKELKPFKVDATEITYIYHLIQNFKIKGLTKDAYTFSKILLRIGEISKIVSYYDSTAKRLTEDISNWALTLDNPFIPSELPQPII